MYTKNRVTWLRIPTYVGDYEQQILINSNTVLEKDVASIDNGNKKVTTRDYETTIAGNTNNIECYELNMG